MCELIIELSNYSTLLNSMFCATNFLEHYNVSYAQFNPYDYADIPHNFIELPNYGITIIFKVT